MRKKIILLILFFSILCFYSIENCFADESRWVWVCSDSTTSTYVDKQGIVYDDRQDSEKVWTKIVTLNGTIWLKQYEINFDNKTMRELSMVDGKTEAVSTLSRAILSFEVTPETSMEKVSDVVTDALNKPRIWNSDDSNRWKWIKSTDVETVYIMPSSITYDLEADSCSVWVAYKNINSTHLMCRRYTCFFYDRMIQPEYDSKIPVIPDSISEAIYNAVKTYDYNKGTI